MSLPDSRNTTYTTVDPVRSNDLNDIQDCIIGAKHPDLEIAYHASDFQPDGATAALDQNGYWLPSGVGFQYAPIKLPVGTRILAAIFYYNVGGAGACTPKIRRLQLSTGTISDVVAGVRDTTGAAIETQTLAANHTVVTGYAYFLEMKHENAANKHYGVILTYDR